MKSEICGVENQKSLVMKTQNLSGLKAEIYRNDIAKSIVMCYIIYTAYERSGICVTINTDPD